MKYLFKNIYYLLALSMLAFSCNESEDLVTADAIEGGLVDVTSSSLNYVVGNTGPYTIEFFLNQRSDIYVEKIELYKSFTGKDIFEGSDGEDSIVFYTSNEIMDRELSIEAIENHFITTSYEYSELIDGLIAKDASLPSTDLGLQIGDAFSFRVVTFLNDGREIEQRYTINVAVSTRLAGTYTVIESSYIHPTAGPQGNWNGDKISIASVDAKTYHILANGPFTPDNDPDNSFYFEVEGNTITIPKEYKGAVQTVWGADEVANCIDNPSNLTNVNCDESNFVVLNDSGADVITMSHGYIRTSGTREFYYVLVKDI